MQVPSTVFEFSLPPIAVRLHANPSVTLEVCSYLFARREHGDLARQALEASYAAMRREPGPAGAVQNGVA
jgi:hypothetical protein